MNNLRNPENAEQAKTDHPINMALTTNDLTMRFGKSEVLSHVNVSVPEGSVYALLGRNGAGKSTLMQIAMGIQNPTSGSVSVLGMNPQKQGPQLRQRIGYIPERMPLYEWMTVDQIIRFVADQYKHWDKDEEDRLVAKFKLDRKKKVKDLSRGNVALLLLVMSMSHSPELVLLDEATSGMDAIFRAEFDRTVIETLQEAKHTVVFASHQLRELEFLCDWVGIIHEGKLLLELPVEQLKSEVKTLRIEGREGIVLPSLPGELSRQAFGREYMITVRNSRTSIAMPDSMSLIETIDLTLEQIFVALLTDRGEQE